MLWIKQPLKTTTVKHSEDTKTSLFSNGKIGYRTKVYEDVIPDNCTITVTNDDRLSIGKM
jgi:hypothetical protein